MELYNQIESLIKDLKAAVLMLRKTGGEYAEAERDYKILLREECLKLRDEGMAIGMIDKVCYGIPSVARARFERDKKLVIYEANKESINSTKTQIRVLEGQLQREWSTDLND